MKRRPTLETDRLRLRPFVLTDAPTVTRLAGDRAVADTTTNVPHPYPARAARQWIRTHQPEFEAGRGCVFAIILKKGGALIGAMGLRLSPAQESAELGYWLGQPYWNNGYATEAAQAVVDFGFQALGLHRIQARHLKRNPASGRVMQKLGLRREGLFRQALKKGNQFEDVVQYAILRPDWENARRRRERS